MEGAAGGAVLGGAVPAIQGAYGAISDRVSPYLSRALEGTGLMPTMPGDMFYLAVQKIKPHLCSRFLFVTGHGDDPRANAFLQSTDGLVVFKPVAGDELIQMISLVLQRNTR